MDSKKEEVADNKTHHILCIPWPVQSHIKAMLKLAKLLHSRGFHITFVNTEYNQKRFLKSLGPDSLHGLPDFQFETIPDGLPPSDADATQDLISLLEAFVEKMLAPFCDLLKRLNDMTRTRNDSPPPVTRIVSDGFLPFTIAAGRELGIPVVFFYTISACSFMVFKQLGTLLEKLGPPPVPKDIIIDWIPGMKEIHVRDMPRFFWSGSTRDHFALNFCIEGTEKAHQASAIIFHTFNALEQDVLDAISSMFPKVFAIGPLQLLLNYISEHPLKLKYSLWKEDSECLQWLNTKPKGSVLYVNFGSIAVMSPQQLAEFGYGIANSKHPFLWIIRPDLVGGETAVLPPEFAAETKGRGLIGSWCPQEEVLNHPSIGGFLTHNGWNSTVESLSSGVPLLCCPFLGDQPTNCRFSCKEWGIGMEMDKETVKREGVKKLVKELMEGEKGKKMRKNVMEWKRLAHEATEPNGSSSIDLDNLVSHLIS
ncbi:7-deoxyloganetin glucosyltransferase [Ziziphus jujuba]|uniref:7-deoxyloganetin glucosyltransferase n=1 Tax=Ziziphus jujuba TaxID=326968 RepID=A0A6P3ZSV7_ZIZJJ|nr:7-deoxyloganetin glucosyltransferase [Ziziphus jujuba]